MGEVAEHLEDIVDIAVDALLRSRGLQVDEDRDRDPDQWYGECVEPGLVEGQAGGEHSSIPACW